MKRIDFISKQTNGYKTVLDIGCDHGLVLKKAFQKGYIEKGIASDLREKPLLSAKNNLKQYPVTFYQSNGFEGIKEDFDLAVICGMGAILITEILSKAPTKKKDFLLGANDRLEELRVWLESNHFKIIDESVIYDKFYYVFIKVTEGTMKLSKEDILVGPVLKKKPESKDYYRHLVKYYEDLLNKIDLQKKANIIDKINFLKNNL
ncbi:conserved hypothetical protein [Alteracholeplasma palmae J233]|uniref:SAM-dependent methyltransferase n=1 Tax=Alteracholeplasma palmae (strain ATCC 49389 / J233) TaxID=1318466 RepID=U4KKM5_ALTPJ|nr:class I SAM-dependent methyltransferase [Alteracholeplasma palmae]CCV64168.1 conserved hypothetical protein [Alteracholeplasma palmae J233]